MRDVAATVKCGCSIFTELRHCFERSLDETLLMVYNNGVAICIGKFALVHYYGLNQTNHFHWL